jgi:hypothetical protein
LLAKMRIKIHCFYLTGWPGSPPAGFGHG